MTSTYNLTAVRHESRVLGAWLDSNDGARARAGVAAPQATTIGENASLTGLSADKLLQFFGSPAASSGVSVTSDTAMRVAAVYACVGLISGAIMGLPLNVYERSRDATGRPVRDQASHEYWWMLNEQANEHMSAATAWEYLVSARMFHGDGFAELLRPSVLSSRVIGWQPHHPLRVHPFRDPDDRKRVLYRVYPEDGSMYVVQPEDMIHLPSLGFDGLTSPSPITYAAREAIGTAVAAERYAGGFFTGGAQFDYALKTDATLSDTQYRQQIERLLARGNSRVPLVLHGGLTPAQLSVNSKDAEILATRVFTVEEICRILGVPPFMVGHTEKTTSWGSGIEQLSIAFVRYTLRRHLTVIAQEFNRKLWPTRERFFVEHDTAALERGDMKSRFEAHRIALGRAGEPGFMKVNEIRRIENLPPVAGGEDLNPGQGNSNAQPPAQTAG